MSLYLKLKSQRANFLMSLKFQNMITKYLFIFIVKTQFIFRLILIKTNGFSVKHLYDNRIYF